MQKAELDYLKFEKRKEGKDFKEIDEEIDFLVGSQIEFKKVKKEINRLNKIINKKDKEIFKLKKQLGKKKESEFKDDFKELVKENKKEDSKDNLKGYIKRVINHLEKDREYTKTDISKELCIPSVRINEVLILLKDLNNIDFRIDGSGVARYKLI